MISGELAMQPRCSVAAGGVKWLPLPGRHGPLGSTHQVLFFECPIWGWFKFRGQKRESPILGVPLFCSVFYRRTAIAGIFVGLACDRSCVLLQQLRAMERSSGVMRLDWAFMPGHRG